MILPRFGFGFSSRPQARPRDLRTSMIRETNLFINWALKQKSGIPRIPTRPVNDARFAALLQQEHNKALTKRWWQRTLGPMWPHE